MIYQDVRLFITSFVGFMHDLTHAPGAARLRPSQASDQWPPLPTPALCQHLDHRLTQGRRQLERRGGGDEESLLANVRRVQRFPADAVA